MEAKTETPKLTKKQAQKELAKVMGGEMIEIKLELFSPFVKFLKEYLSFFGCKKPLEQLCMEMIYEETEYLFTELENFVHNKTHFLESDTWYWKHPHMSAVSTKEEEETEEQESKKDC